MTNKISDHVRKSLRQIPQVNDLLESPDTQKMLLDCPRNLMRELIRTEVDKVRSLIIQGLIEPTVSSEQILCNVEQALGSWKSRKIQRVINATGIVIHTNLGRVPMAEVAVEAAAQAARNYTNLEMDLETGKRGRRGGTVGHLLTTITGAESALIVNNNAAAVLLALSTIAKDGDVIVSRGEMVEIGGGFRITDVIQQSGARMVEVGSTNKTRLEDYAHEVRSSTKVLLKVHPSNFKISGFTEETTVSELSGLARNVGVLVMNDLGSGSLMDLTEFGLSHETTASEMVSAGADIVTVSGDKLLGGPQCGIILGRKELISAMGSNPLFRAVRADKMTLAALEATLELYMDRTTISYKLPTLKMLLQSSDALRGRLNRMVSRLCTVVGLEATICDSSTFVGGGALPMEPQETVVLRIRNERLKPDDISKRLRTNNPPIISMIKGGYIVIDLRTVQPEDDLCVELALANAFETRDSL